MTDEDSLGRARSQPERGLVLENAVLTVARVVVLPLLHLFQQPYTWSPCRETDVLRSVALFSKLSFRLCNLAVTTHITDLLSRADDGCRGAKTGATAALLTLDRSCLVIPHRFATCPPPPHHLRWSIDERIECVRTLNTFACCFK